MNIYRSPNWDRYRGEALKIGLIISLSFVFFAFNYTTYEKVLPKLVFEDIDPIQEIIPERTIDFPKPRPPVIKDLPDIILPEPPPRHEEEIVHVSKETETEEVQKITQEEPVNTPVKFIAPPVPKPKRTPIVTPEPDFEESEEYITFADYMPLFGECTYDIGDKSKTKLCSDKAILNYFNTKLKYPSIAINNGIEGKVFVEFHIDKNGNIKDAIIRRDIGGGCGNEVLRVIKNMPKWKAGKNKGRPVAVKFTMPVTFKLSR